MGEVTTAFAEDEVLERRFVLPEVGEGFAGPGRMAIGFHLLDYVAHAWDVAVTIGAPWEPAPELTTTRAARRPSGPGRGARGCRFRIPPTDRRPRRRPAGRPVAGPARPRSVLDAGAMLRSRWCQGPVGDSFGDRAAAKGADRGMRGRRSGPLLVSVTDFTSDVGVNIEELYFAGRRCLVKAKGARAKVRRRGQARGDCVLEPVYWDAGTARLLPRLLKGRSRGPVFVTHRRPVRARSSALVTCARTRAWPALSYRQARALLDEHTALRGPGTGWDLHEHRHSALTHLGEQGASLLMLMLMLMLMTKSRHRKPENVRRYFKPSPEAISG